MLKKMFISIIFLIAILLIFDSVHIINPIVL